MVSISKPQFSGQAESYYKKENYYQKNGEIGKLFGKGLVYLNLQNIEFTEDTYKQLLEGFNPKTNEKLVKNAGTKYTTEYKSLEKLSRDLRVKKLTNKDAISVIKSNKNLLKYFKKDQTIKENLKIIKNGLEKEERRAGFDVTFSAPKSVSILLELLESNGLSADHLREAHFRANQFAMKRIQEEFVLVRTGKDGVNRIKTDGLMYASFQHDSSRALDPQLHNHNFIFNLVPYRDEKGVLKTLTLTNDEIFNNKMYMGQLYRNQLAHELQKLGYEIEISNAKEGFFEVKGFEQEQLQEFSAMSEMLENEYALNLENLIDKYPALPKERLKEMLKMAKRPQNIKTDRHALRAINLKRLSNVGIDLDLFEKIKSEKEPKRLPDEVKIELLKKATSEMGNNLGVFTKENLSREMMKYTLEYAIIEDDFIHLLSKIDNLIQLGKNDYTSKELLKSEKFVIENLHRKSYSLSTDQNKISTYLKKKKIILNPGQISAVETVLSTKSQFLAIQGDAGSGKTFSLKVINDNFKNEYDFVGLAPTGQASKNLEKDSGINSQTVDSYLLKPPARSDKKRVVFVDEAGMLGSINFAKLMRSAEENGDKIIFIGDTKQLQSVSAGQMFLQAQKYGMETVFVTENIRQKTKEMIDAVTETKVKRLIEAIQILDSKNLVHEQTKEESINSIVESYDDETLVIAQKNVDRNEINKRIREKKDFEGETYILLNNINLQNLDKYNARNYDNAIIQIGKVPGFRAGEKIRVTKIIDNERVDILNRDGKTKQLNIKAHADKLQAFHEVQKKLAVGEKIVFTKKAANKDLTVQNGTTAVITHIEDNMISVTLDNGKNKIFDITKVQNIEYGYALTDYKSQGMTVTKVSILSDIVMSNFNSFYTQLTRAKEKATIYTQDKAEYIKKIQNLQVKQTTLDYTKGDKQNERSYKSNDLSKVRGNAKEPITADKFANRTREAISSYISNLIEHVGGRIRRRIAHYRNAGRNYTKARQVANNVKDMQMAAHINEIKKNLDPNALFQALNLNKDDYEIFKKNDEFRIKIGTRAYNNSDFLTKYINMNWKDASALLQETYSNQAIKSVELSETYHEIQKAKSNELEFINNAKKEINLADFAASFGFKLNKAKTSQNWIALKNDDGEKILVYKRKEQYRYYNVDNENDKGTIYDFLNNRGFNNQYKIYMEIKNRDLSKVESMPIINEAKSSYSVDFANDKYYKMKILRETDNNYLQKRGLSKELTDKYSSIKVDDKNNVVTPMYAHHNEIRKVTEKTNYHQVQDFAICGYNQKLAFPITKDKDGNDLDKPLKDLNRGKKSITVLKPDDFENNNVQNIVVSESFIDALSYVQLKDLKTSNTLIISTNGQTNEKSLELINELSNKYNKAGVKLSFDNDAKGEKMAQSIKERIPRAVTDLPKQKDWNEELIAQTQAKEKGEIDSGKKSKSKTSDYEL